MARIIALAVSLAAAFLMPPVLFASAEDLTATVHGMRQSDNARLNCPVTRTLKQDYAGKPYWKKVRVCA